VKTYLIAQHWYGQRVRYAYDDALYKFTFHHHHHHHHKPDYSTEAKHKNDLKRDMVNIVFLRRLITTSNFLRSKQGLHVSLQNIIMQ